MIPEGRLWQELSKAARKLDDGWLRNHQKARLVGYGESGNGWRYEWQTEGERRVYYTDYNGNPVMVTP